MSPDIIRQLQANASAPTGNYGPQRTRWVNGQLVLNDQPTPKKKNFVSSLLPSVGGIGGGAAGAAIGTALLPGVGTLAGALLGGALGGGAGKVAENATEGNRLTSGVAGEAALNGVLSAGPLRLAKLGADAVRGVKAGTGLADALRAGGEAAQNMSATRALGNKLSQSGQNLIAKEFRLNPTQQFNFKNLHGEDATSIIRRYGIKAPEDVTAKIEPLQNAFDSVISQVPAVSKNDLAMGLRKVYQPLIKSPALFERGLGQQVKTQADELVKLAQEGSIPATKVNELRKTFDAAVNYTQKGAPEYNVIKKTADALRSTLQTAADKAGVKTPEGLSFKEVGKELRKLYGLDDVIGKQAYLGTGSLPANIPSLLGAVGGGVAGGGPLGAVGGIAATGLVNSPMGRRLAANGTLKLGERLLQKGEKSAANSMGIRGVSKRIAPIGLAQALASQSLPNNSPTSNASVTTTNPITNADMVDQPYSQNPDLSSALDGRPQSSPYDVASVESNVQKIIQGGGTAKDVQEYLSIADAINSLKAKAAKASGAVPLNSTAAGVVADTQTGLRALGDLSNSITNSSANSPLLGGLRALNPYDTNAQSLQAQVATAKQIVGKALEGGVLRKEDEAKYAKLLPTMRDSDAVAQFKIQQLQQLIGSRLNDYLSSLGASGGGVDTQSLATALGI